MICKICTIIHIFYYYTYYYIMPSIPQCLRPFTCLFINHYHQCLCGLFVDCVDNGALFFRFLFFLFFLRLSHNGHTYHNTHSLTPCTLQKKKKKLLAQTSKQEQARVHFLRIISCSRWTERRMDECKWKDLQMCKTYCGNKVTPS